MTKEKYMALADFQALWNDKLKPWINGQKADKSDVDALASAIGVDTNYDFVDLGLPSGTLWARCNVGATKETDNGGYFMFGKGSRTYNASDSRYTGQTNPLPAEYDTAAQVMGTDWHIPSEDQKLELKNNTDMTVENNFNGSGVSGVKFTSRADSSKYIFIPYSGYYEEGQKKTDKNALWLNYGSGGEYANIMRFGYLGYQVADSRLTGYPVRGVSNSIATIPRQLDAKADKSDTYTKDEVDNMALATMFRLYVDPEDMHLKGRNIQDGTFEVVDGHLILHQTE